MGWLGLGGANGPALEVGPAYAISLLSLSHISFNRKELERQKEERDRERISARK